MEHWPRIVVLPLRDNRTHLVRTLDYPPESVQESGNPLPNLLVLTLNLGMKVGQIVK